MTCHALTLFYASLLSTKVERDASLRLKGENGIMRKKFMALQKDIESQKDEIKALFDHKKELYSTIGSLEKDIGGAQRLLCIARPHCRSGPVVDWPRAGDTATAADV